MNRRELGEAGERRAEEYLRRAGLTLVQRNYHCGRGEIDLICRQGPLLVFVEVRQRKKNSLVSAAESIDWRKRRKLRAAAEHYLSHLDPLPDCRFDAVCIDGAEIQWLQNIEL